MCNKMAFNKPGGTMKKMKIAALALIVGMLMLTTGCEFFAALLTVDGSVVNARAASTQTDFWLGKDSATLVDAKITLTNVKDSTKTYSAIVNSKGKYSIESLASGKYKVEGEKTGWTFIPRYIEVSGFLSTLPSILAYETAGIDASDILIMVEWQDVALDVDSYVVRDNSDNSALDGNIIVGYDDVNNTYIKDPAVVDKVTLERDINALTDVSVPRVETIRITAPNVPSFEQLRYYVRLYNQSAGSLTGDGTSTTKAAAATVYVQQGTTNMGTYTLAQDSSEQQVGVVAMEYRTWSDGAMWYIGSFGATWLNGGSGTIITGMKSLTPGPVVVSEIK